MSQSLFDIAIIGSGPGGYRAAVIAALRGQQVAIIEKHQWGGCCLNRGCVPKKDWYHTARLLEQQHYYLRGIEGKLTADIQQAWQHQHQIVSNVRDSYIQYMQRLGIRQYQGHGRLQDSNTIAIERADTVEHISSRFCILASGSTARIPHGFEPTELKVLTTDMLFESGVPAGKRVAIVGSGVIASEFAYILTQLGLDVSWLCRSRPLHRSEFSQPALTSLSNAFEGLAIAPVYYKSLEVSAIGDNVTLTRDEETLDFDWILLASGRIPHTSELGLEHTQVQVSNDGFILRDEYLQTKDPQIYAIGDCASPQMTANQALDDASVAIDNILQARTRKSRPIDVPQVVYSALELARVGLNEDQAEDAGHEPAVGFASFEHSPLALGKDQTQGFVRIIGDMDSGQFLGGEIVGDDAGELIQLLDSPSGDSQFLRHLLARSVNHPSRAEELVNAVETMASKWGMGELLNRGPSTKE
ncbi:MAG: NAD(P)/FAD-dependent oxidoreductase [Gammaproteobacteria bacterium]|nr:NAD(P)/FAD-dependent oxidoreductase [Gammaproteobacteria bacterium]